jgi:hypothetical protein
MTPAELVNLVRYNTRTNSSTFTDTNILMLLNLYIDDFSTEIIKADEDYFGVPQFADLALNDDNSPQREIPLPADNLNQIKMVEAKLDGSHWIPLTELDLTQYNRTTDEATIASIFGTSEGRAFFDIFRNSLWLYTGTFGAVSQGLKLWSFQWAAHITNAASTTDLSEDPSDVEAGFPRAFHELLARRVGIHYKTTREKPLALTDNEIKFSVDFQSKIDSIEDMDQKRPNTSSMPDEREYDNGYNL